MGIPTGRSQLRRAAVTAIAVRHVRIRHNSENRPRKYLGLHQDIREVIQTSIERFNRTNDGCVGVYGYMKCVGSGNSHERIEWELSEALAF